MFDLVSYNKGGSILHMLRSYLGDEAFFAGMNRYLDANKFKPAEYNQLRIAFEDISGEDLNWFFDQWIETTKTIDYKIKKVDQKDGKLTVEIQRKGGMQMPLDITIRTKNKNKINLHIPNTTS